MTDTTRFQAEIAAAQTALDELRAEQQALNSEHAKASAVETFDADKLISLEARADILPRLLIAAEAKLVRTQLQLDEACMPDWMADEKTALEKSEAKRKAFEKAQREFDDARSSYEAAWAGRRDHQMDMADRRRRLEDLTAQLRRSPAPVVRSRLHEMRGVTTGA